MTAYPIIPGRLYLVNYRGQVLTVIAPNGCAAICIGLSRFFDEEDLPCAA
jgi:hypothetical protein